MTRFRNRPLGQRLAIAALVAMTFSSMAPAADAVVGRASSATIRARVVDLVNVLKNAREAALLPYASRTGT